MMVNPPIHHSKEKEERDLQNHDTAVISDSGRDLFLTPDERYQVWLVKAAERPHLLLCDDDDDDDDCTFQGVDAEGNDEKKCADETQNGDSTTHRTSTLRPSSNDDDDQHQPHDRHDDDNTMIPLQDGCDIPGWRRHYRLAGRSSNSWRALLRVGPGCRLTRRLESTFPVRTNGSGPSSNKNSTTTISSSSSWRQWQERLWEPPSSATAPRVLDVDIAEVRSPHPWFERERVPVVVRGACDTWPAMQSCRFSALVQRWGHHHWRCSDTHGETMTLRTYQKYCEWEGLYDDAPLAVYDSQWGEDADERAVLALEYTVPPCFDGTDLFAQVLSHDEQRPPYRWILSGPERSGTGWHVDPVGTHAWVSLIEGSKRWILVPPDTDMDDNLTTQNAMPSVVWFTECYDTFRTKMGSSRMVEVLQFPGETVFVPAGWPHIVLNLGTRTRSNSQYGSHTTTMTTAITHNYATQYPSLVHLFHELRAAEPELAERFRVGLQQRRPDLYELWQRQEEEHVDSAVNGEPPPQPPLK